MANSRKLVFINDYVYHVYNRGVEKRRTFVTRRDYLRFKTSLSYYLPDELPTRFSKRQLNAFKDPIKGENMVDVIAWVLMPNHFHLLIRQRTEGGISKYLSKITNSYTKYFNTKNGRVGPLFQGIFKAVYIEDDDQLLHVSRYIHLNPAVSSIVKLEDLDSYEWSSFPSYIYNEKKDNITSPEMVLDFFPNANAYRKFVFEQIEHDKEAIKIGHLQFKE